MNIFSMQNNYIHIIWCPRFGILSIRPIFPCGFASCSLSLQQQNRSVIAAIFTLQSTTNTPHTRVCTTIGWNYCYVIYFLWRDLKYPRFDACTSSVKSGLTSVQPTKLNLFLLPRLTKNWGISHQLNVVIYNKKYYSLCI